MHPGRRLRPHEVHPVAVLEGELVRLQCYEGIDEARALYEWNHAKQLLRITANTALAQTSSSGVATSTSTTNSAADAQPGATPGDATAE